MKFCTQCGQKLASTDKFCSGCGSKIGDDSQVRQFNYILDYKVFGLWRSPESEWASADSIDFHFHIINSLCEEFASNSADESESCEEELYVLDEYELSETDRTAVQEIVGQVDRPIEGVGFTCRVFVPVRLPAEMFTGMSEDEAASAVADRCESGIEIAEASFWSDNDAFEEVHGALSDVQVEAA